MAHITQEERQAICAVLQACRKWGYGNILSHVKAAWVIQEMVNYGVSRESAIGDIQSRDVMCLSMHLDIVQLGWWDDTGGLYERLSPPGPIGPENGASNAPE